MINSSFLKKSIFALSIISLASCDTDYNDIGADIIDDDINHNIIKYNAGVTAYDRATGAVQSNNMDVNLLGVLDDAVFGKTTAHFVTQLELETLNPVITENAVIDSVYLYVPFQSRVISSSGTTAYELDAIYGNPDAKFNLSIYKNGYYLRDSDPGTSEAQKYYSDDFTLIENNKGPSLLEGSEEAIQVSFASAEVERKADKTPDDEVVTPEVVERLAPGFLLYLKKDIFQQQILEAGSANLLNNNIFKNYFRGVYFKASQLDNQSIMGAPNFGAGTITILYTDDKFDLNGDPVDEDGDGVNDQEKKKIILNLEGNTINFFETEKNPDFNAAITSSDNLNGDERLYIKGGDGSMAFIELNMDDLNTLKEENIGQQVLINEANIFFYIDEAAMADITEPMRVYLYDVDNKRPLYDYYADVTTDNSDAKRNKYVHGGLRGFKDENNNNEHDEGEPTGYRIKITNHINNIVSKDSTNVRLGLVITENINNIGNAVLKNPLAEEDADQIPASAIKQPLGTVLYGSNNAVPEDKRLKLEIFYTKPTN